MACLAFVAAFSGDRAQAERLLSSITDPECWVLEAVVAVVAGDRTRAMAALERGYEIRSSNLLLIGADPIFAGLRADPRFRNLMGRVGVRPLEHAPA